jgi:6-phosphogluconolactonase
MEPEILVASRQTLVESAARRIERAAQFAIAQRGRFTIALPGGSVAAEFFPRLSRISVDWRRTDFFWSDERAVPPDDPESNFGQAERLWLAPAAVPEENRHRLRAELQDLEAAAAAAQLEMIADLGAPPRLDLLWLGAGEDGHVASLFPGSPMLDERWRFVVAVTDSPKPPSRRLTLTLAAIAAARMVVVTALGRAKAGAIAAALREADSRMPLALALAGAESSWLLLDPEAGSGLPADCRKVPRQ